ncbi:hypothetical protein BD410DRAFT_373414 [Rickenella mellea]|uniref:Uncharacterized protein n=1 Tax=Rickenella mellea TaxID=50990 RepID=A0A4Y7PYK4_9AGAM|nr:hypothetical protein BD410DRAFT_373414 [Rickenella mellea]
MKEASLLALSSAARRPTITAPFKLDLRSHIFLSAKTSKSKTRSLVFLPHFRSMIECTQEAHLAPGPKLQKQYRQKFNRKTKLRSFKLHCTAIKPTSRIQSPCEY